MTHVTLPDQGIWDQIQALADDECSGAKVVMSKLDGVHPRLVASVLRILSAMAALGHPMVVTDGVRSAEAQARLYAQGRTAPGPIVTNCDGLRLKSNHQPKEDGLGHAVDCAFLMDGKPSWSDAHPWKVYGALAEHEGLVWGGSWSVLIDRPHIELRSNA